MMQAEIFNAVGGLALALFLPGFPLTLALWPKKGLEQAERLLFSILLSLSTTVVSAYALKNAAGLAINGENLLYITAALSVSSALIYLMRLRGLPEIYIETHEYNAARIMKIMSLIILMALVALLAYMPHIGYMFPLSVEEWVGIGGARDQSTGYDILLAEISIYTGQDLAVFQRFLPPLFSAVTALGLYVHTYRLSGSRNAGLLSMLFLAGGPLSGWSFTPQTLGYVFIYSAIYTSVSGMHSGEKTRIVPAALFFFALALIHPVSLLIALPVAFIYLFARPSLKKKNTVWAAALFMILALSSGQLLGGFMELSAQAPAAKALLDPKSPEFLLTTFFAVLSSYLIIKEKKKDQEVLCTWLFLMITLSIVGRLFGINLPNQYIILPLLPLAAIGVQRTLVRVNKVTKQGFLSMMVSLLFVASMAYIVCAGDMSQDRHIQKQLTEEAYGALKTLGFRQDENASVYIRPHLSYVVHPITGKQPAQVPSEESYTFFTSSSCTEKEQIMKRHNVTYIVVESEDYLDCPAFREIYYHEGVYIYKTDSSVGADGGI